MINPHLDDVKTFNFFDKWFYLGFAILTFVFAITSNNYVWLVSTYLALSLAHDRYIKNSNSPK